MAKDGLETASHKQAEKIPVEPFPFRVDTIKPQRGKRTDQGHAAMNPVAMGGQWEGIEGCTYSLWVLTQECPLPSTMTGPLPGLTGLTEPPNRVELSPITDFLTQPA